MRLTQHGPALHRRYRTDDVTLRQGDAPAQLLAGLATTAPLFDVLGVKPLVGRGLQPGDDRENAARVAVISHSLWQERSSRMFSIRWARR